MVDTRRGNPFDAIATTGESTLYLEAKGTQSSGGHVLVTAGEVAWARTHQCVIGIVSGVRFQPDGQLDTTSGTLRIYPWSPREGGPDTHPVPVDPRTEKDQPEML